MSGNAIPIFYNVNIPLADFLVLRNAGTLKSLAFSVLANTTVTQADNPIEPDPGDKGILISSIQFDGVNAGQVSYDFLFDQHEVSGYAINQIPRELMILVEGKPKYTIENSQSTTIVCVIEYVSIPNDVFQRDILSALFGITPGGQFGIVKGS